eukprot:TRINITY_DN175_c0_g4_i1.p1 TRINITY_DN175_c0_g4~~TRINITY_DN175_c0_g4_i1.p1  ORF type:complete len:1341 (-),score=423.23 TRINITY_DN175_c0_g4_i1:70-4032(-)
MTDHSSSEEGGSSGAHTVEMSDSTVSELHAAAVTPSPPSDDASGSTLDADEVADEIASAEEAPKEKAAKLHNPFKMWKYSDPLDYLLVFIGILAALGQGAMQPLMAYFLGDMVDAFYPIYPDNMSENASNYADSIKLGVHMPALREKVRIMFYLGLGCFFGSLIFIICFRVSSLRQAIRIRHLYFKSVISQEMGWADSKRAGELSERVNDILKIQEALGDTIGTGISALSTFLAGWVIGLRIGWKMGLVVVAATPSLILSGMVMGYFIKMITTKSQNALAQAGGVAEEVISCMRTVTSFGLQEVESKRYDTPLAYSERLNQWKGFVFGMGYGCMMGCNCFINALGFWYGSTLLRKGEMSAGDVSSVFFAILMGTMSLGSLSPTFQAIAEGQGVAGPLYQIIDRKSQLDPFSPKGITPEINGKVEFHDVEFSYPTRLKSKVLRGLSIVINQGETVALVGPSGCGKSTTVSLLERLYAPTSGSVTVDGNDVADFNLKHLRNNIGMVGQEPVLFAMSIRDNIALGLSAKVEEVDFELIQQAAKEANAHNYISLLPKQYDTLVGERGVQLSGGQKQRIAIARALIRNPKILLLDEATSALDTESERIVQEALDRASKGRTTIIIAHRLSTVQNANNIVVLNKGRVVEQGNHAELMAQNGLYHQLVCNQQLALGSSEGEQKQHHRRKHHSKDTGQIDAVESPSPVEDDMQLSEEVKEQVDDSHEDIAQGFAEEPKYRLSSFRVLLRLYTFLIPHIPVLSVAVFSAAINGCVFPVLGFLSAKIMATLVGYTGENIHHFKMEVIKWAFCFVGLGVVTIVVQCAQLTAILRSYEALVRMLRRLQFTAILRQDVGWFDREENSVGALTTKLASDPPQVEGAAGVKITFTVQAFASLIAGVTIGLVGCWQLALVIIAIMPCFSAFSYFKTKYQIYLEAKTKQSYEDSGTVACEAIEAVRTVVMLGREEKFIDRYNDSLWIPMISGHKATPLVAFCNAMSLASMFVVCAVSFWYGGTLIKNDKTDFAGLMQADISVMLGVSMFSMMNAVSPDFGKAKVALANIFKLVDRVPPIDFLKPGVVPETDRINTITFKNIRFAYPSRPGVTVLNDFNLEIPENKTVALVGASGCGKSTIMGLLQRFYQPLAGEISVNGIEIASLDLRWLRSHIGIVSQEPVLFGTTIKENIARGLCDQEVPTEDIIAAAKLANAHNFISALPQGYDTQVGEKGLQLSGGQKQRVAIARALLRNPKILLLDEATSALDTESEKVVQVALDQARRGRTTIVVAHRLSTVRDADLIVALEKGQVKEMGTHDELLRRRGVYYNLAKGQQL